MTDSIKALQIQFNEYMHRMLVLELIPSMLASGVNPKEINQWQLEHPYQIFEWLDLESLIQKAVTEGRLKELKELRDDPELDLQHYEYDRVDNELLNAQENGEQNIAVAVNDYLAERIATLKNQDKEG